MPFPSEVQRQVIEHRGAPVVVIAGPGTGKTRTIVARMIGLLLEDPSRNITFVTFTRSSRTDTLAKLTAEIPHGALDEADVVTPRVGTLHSTASAIVHRLAHAAGFTPRFSVLIEEKGERELVVAEVVDDLGLGVAVESLTGALVSYLRNLQVLHDPPITEVELHLALDHYVRLLRFYNALGMEEIVFTAANILGEHPELVPAIYLQVDEYQDLNPADQRLVSLVASNPESQVVVVGDDAQSIYGFREANSEGLRNLWNAPGWVCVAFPDCHRLPSHIQRASVALISHEDYLGTQMNPKEDDGRRVLTLQCTRSNYQGTILARKINAFLQDNKRSDGSALTFSDVLVLCPSGKFVPSMREALGSEGIPTRDVSRPDIPAHVWKVILILRLAIYEDNIAFRQWLDHMGMGQDEIAAIRHDAMAHDTGIVSYCLNGPHEQARSILDCARELRDHSDQPTGLIDHLVAFPGMDIPLQQVMEVVSLLVSDDGTLAPRSKWLSALYQRFGVLEDQSAATSGDAALVTTLHSAKGLEAELVCVAWMNERYIPLPTRDPAEERRLLYVAMTRAKQELIMTFHEMYVKGQGYLAYEAMSPFLKEILPYLQVQRITAKDINSPKAA